MVACFPYGSHCLSLVTIILVTELASKPLQQNNSLSPDNQLGMGLGVHCRVTIGPEPLSTQTRHFILTITEAQELILVPSNSTYAIPHLGIPVGHVLKVRYPMLLLQSTIKRTIPVHESQHSLAYNICGKEQSSPRLTSLAQVTDIYGNNQVTFSDIIVTVS